MGVDSVRVGYGPAPSTPYLFLLAENHLHFIVAFSIFYMLKNEDEEVKPDLRSTIFLAANSVCASPASP